MRCKLVVLVVHVRAGPNIVSMYLSDYGSDMSVHGVIIRVEV